MNLPQRIVLVIYCLLLVYCCLWIPFHVQTYRQGVGSTGYYRMGYAWLWIGPDRYATPDGPLIVLRLVAATALHLPYRLQVVVVLSACMAALGLIDDIFQVPAWAKFSLQTMISL